MQVQSARSRAAHHHEMCELRLALPDARVYEIELDMRFFVHNNPRCVRPRPRDGFAV